jgi:hypothetical protein
MLYEKTVPVYCKNHTENTDTLCGQNTVRTSQETHCASDTEPNRLMLFKETVSVYCENHTEHTDTLCGQNAVRTSLETHYFFVTMPNWFVNFCHGTRRHNPEYSDVLLF